MSATTSANAVEAARPLALTLTAALFSCGGVTGPTRPSLPLISLGTLRTDHSGGHGHERATTPFLERWSRQGLVFENGYTHVREPWWRT